MTTNQTIDGVPREFVREGRYIVVKPDYEDDIRTERLRNYIEEMCFHTPACVVVEADWPEYEPVWRMIEARVIGNPTELDAAKATISQLQGLVAELRSLLDATDVLGEIDLTPKRLEHAESVIEQQNNLIASLRAELVESYRVTAQPQGEPVAYRCQHSATEPWFFSDKPGYWEWQALYAEQPAPVAVLMPERLPGDDGVCTESHYASGWNDCLDELKRLNHTL